MTKFTEYGVHRALEPKNTLPQPAWKLDNAMEIFNNEILIDVKIINIDLASFDQITIECQGDISRIERKILEIIDKRGKLHNPVTDTGGILFGKVKKIGKKYNNTQDINVGDYIISTTLSLTPIRIYKINRIHIDHAQIEVEGEAILFSSTQIIKIDNIFSANELIYALDEGASSKEVNRLAKQGDKVLIVEAGGKIGLLCAYAVREKLNHGEDIIGIVRTKEEKNFLSKYNIYNRIYDFDISNTIEAFDTIMTIEKELFDLTINCSRSPGTEILSVLCTKPNGTLYFAGIGSNYKTAFLNAEGIGRDINILAYKGYCEGHEKFVVNLLEKNKDLRNLQENIYRQIIFDKHINNFGTDEKSRMLKEVDINNYVYTSKQMEQVVMKALKVSSFDCNVLINGESGVGKEGIAQIIHSSSNRSNHPFVKINCASIPNDLVESELFGYEKGAFTGAKIDGKSGFFEIANGGTLFLDEISAFPLSLQAKLLRAIQEKEIYRIGGTIPIKIDVRFIAATNRNLKQMIFEGTFREDLFYRLNVYPINVPPLRQRKEDIVPLVKYFIKENNLKYESSKTINEDALQYLSELNWPGNIRELENFIQRVFINSIDEIITLKDVIASLGMEKKNSYEDISNLQAMNLQEILERTEEKVFKTVKNSKMSTREIGKILGISQSTVVRKLKKYNL
ncbi:sigma 54-interacting transcriptional regulator [Clostridium sp. Cult2]|uniref:sigma 54-interacting transcriptional regulator n=1 Tax=Clostridium sp. Cult2 TaxID=2079003 RepID=UPI001F00D4F0|nr:RNA polymerase subunit sigma-54 [Clostridium sp. Cult2]